MCTDIWLIWKLSSSVSVVCLACTAPDPHRTRVLVFKARFTLFLEEFQGALCNHKLQSPLCPEREEMRPKARRSDQSGVEGLTPPTSQPSGTATPKAKCSLASCQLLPLPHCSLPRLPTLSLFSFFLDQLYSPNSQPIGLLHSRTLLSTHC